MRKHPPPLTLYFQPRSRPFVWLLARSWTTQEYGLFCSLSTTYFDPQSTKRHTIFQGWRQKIVQRLQLPFSLVAWKENGARNSARRQEKLCLFSNSSLSHHPSTPTPPPPHPTLKQTVDGTILNDARKEYTSRNSMVYWLAQIARKRQVSIADSYRCLYRVRKPLPLGKMYVRPRFDGIRYSKRKQHFSSLKE